MTTLPLPAPVCAVCARSPEAVGTSSMRSRRIVGRSKVEYVRLGLDAFEDVPGVLVKEVRKNWHLVLRGTVWSAESVERAVEQARNGWHPWLCQPCAGYACACGAPDLVVPGATVLDDDGTRSYGAALPVGRRCPESTSSRQT